MKISLKQAHELAKQRLENKGQCKSCQYLYIGGREYDDFPECRNGDLEKLPETTGKKSWGDKGCPCPLWMPYEIAICDKHGLIRAHDGCDQCMMEISNYGF
jgi:hypothetical protein